MIVIFIFIYIVYKLIYNICIIKEKEVLYDKCKYSHGRWFKTTI